MVVPNINLWLSYSMVTMLCIAPPVETSSLIYFPVRVGGYLTAFGASSYTRRQQRRRPQSHLNLFAIRSSSSSSSSGAGDDIRVHNDCAPSMSSLLPYHAMSSLRPKQLGMVRAVSSVPLPPNNKYIPTTRMMALRMTTSSQSSSDIDIDNTAANENNAIGGVNISIKYCSACRWMLRSNWIASELLTTFANEAKLNSVTMVNQSPPLCEGGIFCISASYGSNRSEEKEDEDGKGDRDAGVVLWDRKDQGRFPESKEVKQLVRDCVNPEKDLGHSDNKKQTSSSSSSGVDGDNDVNAKESDCVECKEEQNLDQKISKQTSSSSSTSTVPKQTEEQSHVIPSIFYKHHHVSIEYSTGSSIDSSENALYKATYYANELLSLIYERNAWWKKRPQQEQGGEVTEDDVDVDGDDDVPAAVDSVTLIPNRLENGILRIKLNDDKVLYEKSDGASDTDIMMDGARLRDIAKDAMLYGGNSDSNILGDGELVIETMDDDEAEDMRKYFGVF
mmetsp:Transcript_4978/g.10991  ORF Transcript_4978/g.10991 Transcript_4978/m.10991 type:complete len:504 (+) Transcript_4978:47-1558(+)